MVGFKIENNTAYITLNRPEVHNAFDDKTILELIDLCKKVNENDELRLCILKAEGKSFCAGADLNWMKKMKDYSFEQNVQDSLKLAELFESFNTLNVPLLGLISGHALGGGVGLVSVCDYALTHSKAKFGFTEVRLGLAPAVISPYVVNKIGESEARAWFFSGEVFSAKRAYDMKLVHEVVNLEDFETRSNEVIESFLKSAPKAGKKTKVFLREMMNSDDKTNFTAQTISTLRVSDEAQEAMSALLEKRKPKW